MRVPLQQQLQQQGHGIHRVMLHNAEGVSRRSVGRPFFMYTLGAVGVVTFVGALQHHILVLWCCFVD
jgi:hypothetical protein